MDVEELYAAADRERIVAEPPKRVAAPVRTAFERDRARVVHAASSRRLAAKTQVVGPQSDDFVRNRLTHTLEVAQVGRDLARALGCHPDVVETACLAHDLGHPPFGHNGERALAALVVDRGGFEGNAQTLRILTRLEAKTHDAEGRSVGLNLTRATLDACTKYPWTRRDDTSKFGVYDDDEPVFAWLREGVAGPSLCVEAQVMDLADDVAYSVHDVEDAVAAQRVDLNTLDESAVWQTVREWYLPEAGDDALAAGLARLRRVGTWPDAPHDGSRRALAQLKNLASDLIGRFCGAVQEATTGTPAVRHATDLVVPEDTRTEIAVLKGIAAHYVMRAEDRVTMMVRQRELIEELVSELVQRPEALERQYADDWAAAGDDTGRWRAVVDQVASLTDASAVSLHARIVRGSSGG